VITFFRSLFAPPRHLILPLVALWIGLTLAERRAERHNVSREALNSLVYYSLFGFIIGGRVFYALSTFSIFLQSPRSLFSLNPDLFDPLAAVVLAGIVGLIYGSRQKLFLWTTLDALTPLFAVLAIGLSLSHLAAGTAFGNPTELPWGIELWNATRHPTQLYELMAASLILVWLLLRKMHSAPGLTFLTFLVLTSGSQLFLEAFRGDSTLIFGGLRLGQVLAWTVLAVTLITAEWIEVNRANEFTAERPSC